jgi:hypothetical protein
MTHADEAARLVLGDRNDAYGNPDADFAGIALMWTGLLNTVLKRHLTATDVSLMMTALKLRRHAHKPKADNLIDAHGYLLCLEWIERGERPTPQSETEHAQALALAETIATGERLECAECGKMMPCMCGHKKT